MTSSERDFDRIARAWLELGPNEAPERPIAAVLQAIETTPQVRRPWRWPTWRSSTMSRITILAVLAGTLAIIVGGLVLTGGGNQGIPVVPVSPSPSPTVSPRPGALGAPLPDAVKGGWSAASRGTPVEGADVTTIVLGGSSMDTSAPQFSLDWPGMSTRRLGSNVVEERPGELLFILGLPGVTDCEARDEGRYRWSVSEDGQWLTLDQVSEACDVRGEILAGTWQRNVSFSYAGGPGIATNIEPYVELTLPDIGWVGAEFADTDTVHTNAAKDDRGFKIWKDLDGFVDPCDRSKGRLLIDPGMDAFLAYLRDDPRFTDLQETEFQIDGHRAVEVVFQLGADISEPCWDFDGDPNNKTGVLLWIPEAAGKDQAVWNGEIDTPGIATVTEVDGVTLVFEAINVKPGEDLTSDREVLDTVRFVDALPTPPPS